MANDIGNDAEKLVNVAFNFEYWNIKIKPEQVKSEIVALCRTVQNLNPKVIIEVGTARGGTLFLFARVANPEMILSIDLSLFKRGYEFWKIPLFNSFGKKHVIKLINADSHNVETLARVRTLLKGKEVDFLFIDGDHTYQGVKKDFQNYSSLVRKGGIVAFHDIVKHAPKTNCHVDKFWSEIKKSYRHVEIIEDKRQKWAGIGVLYL
jgi:cephalosporin hydroxylase